MESGTDGFEQDMDTDGYERDIMVSATPGFALRQGNIDPMSEMRQELSSD